MEDIKNDITRMRYMAVEYLKEVNGWEDYWDKEIQGDQYIISIIDVNYFVELFRFAVSIPTEV